VLAEHTLLQFEAGTPEAEVCARILDMELLQSRTFDWEVMDQLGERARLEGLLSERWRAALAAPAQQYLELTVEFISTLQHTLGDFSAPTVVSFSLGRRIYDMSIPQFAVATGLYTEADVADPQFETRIRGLFRRGYAAGCAATEAEDPA
jgi:hypothetical protein